MKLEVDRMEKYAMIQNYLESNKRALVKDELIRKQEENEKKWVETFLKNPKDLLKIYLL